MATNNTKQALWISLGNLASTLIAVISPMILSRYFLKSDYGTFKQVMYIYTSLLTIFTLGLPKSYSYFLPRVPITESKDLINKITRIFFLLGGVFSCCLFFGASFISEVLKNPELYKALRIFSVVPFLMLPTMGLEGIYASFKKTHIIALYTIITKSLTIICTLIPVLLFGGDYNAAIMGFDIGCAITFLAALYLKTWPIKNYEKCKTAILYNDIFRFSLPLLITALWGMVINSSDQFFISRYYGNEVFAEYSNGFMEFPLITMLISSIITVLIPVFSGYRVGNNDVNLVLDTWMSTMNKSVRIIYPIAIFCIFFSGIIMTCLYGSTYSSSGYYFSIKNIQALFSVLPFSPLILALGKTKEYSIAHLKTAIIVVVLEFVSVHIFSSAISIACVSVFCQFLKVFFQFSIVLSVLHLNMNMMIDWRVICKLTFISVLACFVPLFLNLHFIDGNHWLILVVDIFSFIISYYLMCFLMKITYQDIVYSLFGTGKIGKLLKFIP